ncbi:hypothetical protein [Alicyclobacillus fastidiosus]|uniref:Uncharacterized protein n=1 Tax=Alicyclobacillus fastidiosus TaxID=392011 RepID=A0ABV5ABQ9_9BACL|nr:hypothetical protein [Alicyclobacillus fastidiosus]WEH10972.1 hypothetical protein PYS47_07080 [Alicyclobacillus fastidiosus]
MLPLAQSGYTDAQVKAALHAIQGNRRLYFRYAHLTKDEQYIRDITNLVQANQGSITMDSTADQIKRSATLTIKDDGGINWPQDRIQVFARLYLPVGYVEWAQGIFLLSSPTTKYQGLNRYRDVQAYDPMQQLTDWGFDARYVVNEGDNYVEAVKSILAGAGITKINIDPTDKTLPTWLDWPPDTSRLDVANQLLKLINYQTLHVDENGYFTSHPYQTPQVRAEEYSYVTDGQSVIFGGSNGATSTEDYFSVPNTWIGVVSEASDLYLTYTYTNSDPNSPSSTVSKGRVVTKYIDVQATDLDSLQGIVEQQASQDTMIHQVNFSTAVMPIHSYDDVYHFTHNPLGIDGKFEEQSWTMPLQAGGMMQHVANEVVSI